MVSSSSALVSTFWETWRLTTRTASVLRQLNYWSRCCWLVCSGLMRTRLVRCRRLSLPSASGSSPCTSIMRSRRSSSRRRSSLHRKRPICQSPRKSWKSLKRNSPSSRISWTSRKKTRRSSLISRTNSKHKPPRLKRKSTLQRRWSTRFQVNGQDGEKEPVKSTTKRNDLSVMPHSPRHSSVIAGHSMPSSDNY